MVDQSSSTFTLTLPSDRQIVLSRIFDAPRALVFEAFTSPRHVARWWGPRGTTLSSCDMDFRPGGAWRFVVRQKDGSEFAFRGEYREIVPPERLVQTFEFEGMPGHIAVETLTFEDVQGKTKVTNTALYASVEDRDGIIQSGMEAGARETWDRLAEHLRTMAANRKQGGM